MKTLKLLFATLAVCGNIVSMAQHSHDHGDEKDVDLHVNPRWKECSFQLDPSLTQSAFKEFTKEAGLVIYFRPLTDAKPMGARNFEFAFLKWATEFDDTKDAWNDTFVHPDSAHWLKEGSRLSFPGLTFRMGITDRLDIGAYWTKSPGANYGFYGAQAQYSLLNNVEKNWSTSARASFVKMYGPEDLNLTTYGLDLIASKEFILHEKWARLAPYAGISTYLSCTHEKSEVVELQDEQVFGVQANAGIVAKVAFARIAVEYSLANVNTVSFKLGASF